MSGAIGGGSLDRGARLRERLRAGMSVGYRRWRVPVRFTRDPDAVTADRILDLGQAGLRQQAGKRADGVGIRFQRRTSTAELSGQLHGGASPDSASITLASASSANS